MAEQSVDERAGLEQIRQGCKNPRLCWRQTTTRLCGLPNRSNLPESVIEIRLEGSTAAATGAHACND